MTFASSPVRAEFDRMVKAAEFASGFTSKKILVPRDERLVPRTFRNAMFYVLVVELSMTYTQVRMLWPVPLEQDRIRAGVEEIRVNLLADVTFRNGMRPVLDLLRAPFINPSDSWGVRIPWLVRNDL